MKSDHSKHYIIIVLSFIFLSHCTGPKVQYPNELDQLHKNVLTNILEDEANPAEVEQLLHEMQTDGSWSGIDYASKQRGAWEPRQHLSNVLEIATAYQTEGSEYYHKKVISEKIHLALNYWLENDFQCPNWWYPVIGVPMVLNPIMLLMEAELSEEQKELGLVILNRCEIGKTGQNKVWQSGNVLLTSLLTKDIDTVYLASASIKEELVVSQKEGVQPDWSYHQHGPQLQFGNYGLSYVGDMIKWISILRNTPYQFDEAKVVILRNYLLDGQQWITWKNQMDISACGRQLFVDSPEAKARSLSNSFTKMGTIDPEFADTYNRANDHRTLTGNKHFWRSDIQIQRTTDYYFSVKMCSERVIGAESCNSENIQGYYMGDGVTFLYQTGEEYKNIFPFLDWKKLPGTTIQQDHDPLPILTCSGYRIESDFVGGVSNGQNGIAALDYKRNGLTAKKSWFMFDDYIICLGTDISSSEGWNVTTSINQSYLRGTVIMHNGKQEVTAEENEILMNPAWILHDNIGYVFPEGGKLHLETGDVEGSWNRVASRYPDNPIHAELFRLWVDHGVNPSDGSYVYILVSGADKATLNQMKNQLPFRIFKSHERQEVIAADGSLGGIVFFVPGKSAFIGGISVDKPCLVMAKENQDGLEVAISDPTQKLSVLNLTINGQYNGGNTQVENGNSVLTVSLPRGGDAGKTIIFSLKKI